MKDAAASKVRVWAGAREELGWVEALAAAGAGLVAADIGADDWEQAGSNRFRMATISSRPF